MSQMLLLTIDGPGRVLDLELPGDIPMNDLLPLLLDLCHPGRNPAAMERQGTSGWTFVLQRTGINLEITRTLHDHGVLDGDVVLLQAKDTAPAQISSKPDVTRQTRRNVVPNKQSGWIGVRWTPAE